MQFITSGDRIATENFTLGRIYTVTFNNGNYFINTCIGIGPDYVMFQQTAPKMLFRLDMETAANVDTIDESGGGSGTTNYNELDNKPQINGVTLQGNKTLGDLSIYPVPIVTSEDNNKILTASYVGGSGSYSWQPAPSSGTTNYNDLNNKPQINSIELSGNKSLSDLGIQSVISDLDTIRSGAAAGATAVQPGTLSGYQTLIDSSHKLSSDLVDDDGHDNKFATAAQLAQIETNKNNISWIANYGGYKNIIKVTRDSIKAVNPNLSWQGYTAVNYGGLTFTINDDLSITINGTTTAGGIEFMLKSRADGLPLFPVVGEYRIDGKIISGKGSLVVNRTIDGSGVRYGADTGDTDTFTVGQADLSRPVGIWFGINEVGVSFDDVTIYPMICLASMDRTYQPYCPSNYELYQMILNL